MCELVGALVDLLVGKDALGVSRALGLDDAVPFRVGCGIGSKDVVDGWISTTPISLP